MFAEFVVFAIALSKAAASLAIGFGWMYFWDYAVGETA